MKSKFQRALTPGLIVVVTVLASLLVAGVSTLRSSRDVVDRYVSVWEDEIARNLLLKGDAGLFEKIRLQISDIASDVDATGVDAALRLARASCFGEQTLNVTLYGTPAGDLRICRSPQRLLFKSLTSPVFAFGSLLGILVAMWLVRRSSREESARALTDLAVQVAHDIRSPLTALKIAARRAGQIEGSGELESSDEIKNLIDAATSRITKIADDLLNRNRASQSAVASRSVPPASKPLQESIRELVNEKKLLASPNLVFEIREAPSSVGVPPAMASNDFDRIIANLLQNAIEATMTEFVGAKIPRIIIDTIESAKNISITIRDNGRGIPKEILHRIGDSGFTYGKSSGNGIGLSSARGWAKSRGGNLDIRSLEGTGTEICLVIPR